MITLKPQQVEAASFIRSELAKGGRMTLDAPPGSGKSIVLAEALREYQRVAYISMRPEMREQFKMLCGEMGVTNVEFLHPRTVSTLKDRYDVIVLCETLRSAKVIITHDCVIQC